MTPPAQIAQDHTRIRAEATRLAGRPQDLVQRAQVYLHLYRHSDGRHVFPLLAAHGALWGAGHFRRGQMLAQILSLGASERAAKLTRLADFAHAFKDINRRVCIETYTTYHLTALHGAQGAIAVGIAPKLAHALAACHNADTFGPEQTHALFTAFFEWEQDNVVQDALNDARAKLDWPLMEPITMRPPIRFAYFRGADVLWFRRFHDKSERISKGQRAFALGQQQGWHRVEAALNSYGILPDQVMQRPDATFRALRDHLHAHPHPA